MNRVLLTDEDQDICLRLATRRVAAGVHAHYRNAVVEDGDAIVMRRLLKTRRNNRAARADCTAFFGKQEGSR